MANTKHIPGVQIITRRPPANTKLLPTAGLVNEAMSMTRRPLPTKTQHLSDENEITRRPPSLIINAFGPSRNDHDNTKSAKVVGTRREMILHYTFEKMDEDIIVDESGYNNNARLVEGAFV